MAGANLQMQSTRQQMLEYLQRSGRATVNRDPRENARRTAGDIQAEGRCERAGVVRKPVGITSRIAVAAAALERTPVRHRPRQAPLGKACDTTGGCGPSRQCDDEQPERATRSRGLVSPPPRGWRRARAAPAHASDAPRPPSPFPAEGLLLASAGQVFWLGDHPRPVPSHPSGQWLRPGSSPLTAAGQRGLCTPFPYPTPSTPRLAPSGRACQEVWQAMARFPWHRSRTTA